MEFAASRGRVALPVALLILAVPLCFLAGYAAGWFSVLGYEKRDVAFNGLVKVTRSGSGFGLKRMLFLEGQTFYTRYETEIREGSLRIGILDTFGPAGDKAHFTERLTQSGTGEVSYRIPRAGIYSIYFEGAPYNLGSGRGYDISYAIVWGIR